MKYRKLYDNYWSLHLSRGSKEGTPAAYDYVRRWWKQHYIRQWLPENKQAQVLEIGCGLGYHLHALRGLGYTNLQGIDMSPEEIEIAQNNVKAVDFLVADVFSFLPQRQGQYDLAIMFNILEHFRKDEALEICQLIFNSLRSGGVLLIRTPNATNPASFHTLYSDLTHEMCYTQNSLADLLGLAGFSKVNVVGVRTYNSEDKLWKKAATGALLIPMSWISHILIKLMYFSQRRSVGTVERDILGIGIK